MRKALSQLRTRLDKISLGGGKKQKPRDSRQQPNAFHPWAHRRSLPWPQDCTRGTIAMGRPFSNYSSANFFSGRAS